MPAKRVKDGGNARGSSGTRRGGDQRQEKRQELRRGCDADGQLREKTADGRNKCWNYAFGKQGCTNENCQYAHETYNFDLDQQNKYDQDGELVQE